MTRQQLEAKHTQLLDAEQEAEQERRWATREGLTERAGVARRKRSRVWDELAVVEKALAEVA